MPPTSNSKPLVSIITPTWQRNDLLVSTVEHVAAQTYRPLEHIIVSDGTDPELRRVLWVNGHRPDDVLYSGREVPLKLIELGHNTSGAWPESFGVAPLTVGMLIAKGDYQLWWSDDDRALTRQHISKLVDLLEQTGASFVYPQVRIWRRDDPSGPETKTIGTEPPVHGQITHFLYRRELLRYGTPYFGSHPCDIALVNLWLARHEPYAMLPEVTYSHRLDQ